MEYNLPYPKIYNRSKYFSRWNMTVNEVSMLHFYLFLKPDKRTWVFNAKDFCEQLSPEYLRVALLISSAFPPFCKCRSGSSLLLVSLH